MARIVGTLAGTDKVTVVGVVAEASVVAEVGLVEVALEMKVLTTILAFQKAQGAPKC